MIQNIIRKGERFGECRVFVGQTEQVLVGNDNQRVDNFLKRFDAVIGLLHALATLKLERLGDNADSQNAKFTGCLCDDRGRASSGAAAHTGRDEAHVCASKVVNDLFD